MCWKWSENVWFYRSTVGHWRAQRTTTFSVCVWTYMLYKLLDGFGWGACHWNIGPFNARPNFYLRVICAVDVTYWIRLRMLSLLWRWQWLWQLFLSFYFAAIFLCDTGDGAKGRGVYPTTLAIHILERRMKFVIFIVCVIYISIPCKHQFQP